MTHGSGDHTAHRPPGQRRAAGAVEALKQVLRPTAPYRLAQALRDRVARRGRFDRIFIDTTSSCNLRCPFCINDWSALGQGRLMDAALFPRLARLVPLALRDTCHLSCSYEPTLHRDFISLVEMVPRAHAHQALFTTNLATGIDDGFLARLARSGLGRVQISVESLVPEVYERHRKNARFARFIDNLERLTAAFAAVPGAPRVRFITVASRLNLEEIPALVEQCAARFAAWDHQVRPFYRVHANDAWLDAQELAPGDWRELARRMRGVRARCSLHEPTGDEPDTLNLRYLAVGAEGVAEAGWSTDRRFVPVGRWALAELADPLAFFRTLLRRHPALRVPPTNEAAPRLAPAGEGELTSTTVWSAGVIDTAAGGTRISSR